MSVFQTIDQSVIKPLATAALVAAGEKFIFQNNDIKSIGMYAGAVGASSFAASIVAPAITPDLGINIMPMFNGKAAEMRVIELAFGVGSAWGVNKFILKNNFDFKSPETMKRIGVLVAAECTWGRGAKNVSLFQTFVFESIMSPPREQSTFVCTWGRGAKNFSLFQTFYLKSIIPPPSLPVFFSIFSQG
jgi:hypothetical protein